jgi:hypothetical protein
VNFGRDFEVNKNLKVTRRFIILNGKEGLGVGWASKTPIGQIGEAFDDMTMAKQLRLAKFKLWEG